MRGLAKGEVSSVDNPVLQLFVRSGGFLTDMYSGTYKIESTIGTAAPVTLVATAPFVSGTHKLGTGRYWIPSGATTSWTVGTHRVVCQYKMTATGPTYTQVIDFEVLDSGDWVTGTEFLSYITTRALLQDGITSVTDSTATIHRHLNRVSRQIERWTNGRIFEPRHMSMYTSGQMSPILLLHEAVIAVEDIYFTWQDTSGEQTYIYDHYMYVPYNRHLDGPSAVEDDRFNPRIVLTAWDGSSVKANEYSWPQGNQNIKIIGVFGFTDAEIDPHGGQVILGRTPRDIAYLTGVLLYRTLQDPTMSDASIWRPGSITQMKTRDQSVSFGGGSSSISASSDLTGDPSLDSILMKYAAPVGFAAV